MTIGIYQSKIRTKLVQQKQGESIIQSKGL